MDFKIGLLLAIIEIAVSACTTIPPKEVHTVAGVLRETELDTTLRGAESKTLAFGGTIGRGVGYDDRGESKGFTTVSGLIEYRPLDWLGFGGRLGLANVDGDYDSSMNGVYKIFVRARYLRLSRWHFYASITSGYASNSVTETGQTCYFLSCHPNDLKSSSKVTLADSGFSLTEQYFFSDRSFLAFTPAMYLTYAKSSYDKPVPPVSYSTSALSPNYSAVLDYGYIAPGAQGIEFLIHFGAGAAVMKGYGLDTPNYRVSPLVFLGIRIGLLPRLKDEPEVEVASLR